MQLGPLLDRGHAAPPPRSSILQLATLCMQALTLFVVMWVMLPASDCGARANPQNNSQFAVQTGGEAEHGRGGSRLGQASAAPPGGWCASDHRAGDVSVHRPQRCTAAADPDAAAAQGKAVGNSACASPADAARPAVIIMTIAMNNESFGRYVGEAEGRGPRGVDGYLGMLAEQDYPACRVSLGLLVSSEAFYPAAIEAAERALRARGMARLVVMHMALDVTVDPALRHLDSAQRQRRGVLARLRNAALALALDLEDTVFWVDADVVAMPKHTISALVGSGKDIVTTITKKTNGELYDLNAWRGPRLPYDPAMGKNFVPGPVDGKTQYPDQFEAGPDDFVPLDSVGGCTLLVRAAVHREGALFAPLLVVGTTWEAEGFDGIETEGLCYVARFMGRSCWLAAHIVTVHQSLWG